MAFSVHCLVKRCHFIKLLQESSQYRYYIQVYEYILVFSNVETITVVGGNHWICISSDETAVVKLMDSARMSSSINLETSLQIANIYCLPTRCSALEIQALPTQQQRGTKDCEVFSIAFAVEVCAGNILSKVKCVVICTIVWNALS